MATIFAMSSRECSFDELNQRWNTVNMPEMTKSSTMSSVASSRTEYSEMTSLARDLRDIKSFETRLELLSTEIKC